MPQEPIEPLPAEALKQEQQAEITRLVKESVAAEVSRIYRRMQDYEPYQEESINYMIPKRDSGCVEVCELGLAIPPEVLWYGYGKTAKEYLNAGKNDAKFMFDILNRSGFSLGPQSRILDFGCAAGRVTRGVYGLQPESEIWGADIHAERIVWCRQHLMPPLNFVLTTKNPRLPFADSYFDLIYAFSVFTHIDDLADSWMLELRRLLRLGGRAYITIMDRSTIEAYKEEYREWEFPKIMAVDADYNRFIASDFGMFSIARNAIPQVWYDMDYFCQKIQGFFRTVSVIPKGHGWQTCVELEAIQAFATQKK